MLDPVQRGEFENGLLKGLCHGSPVQFMTFYRFLFPTRCTTQSPELLNDTKLRDKKCPLSIHYYVATEINF